MSDNVTQMNDEITVPAFQLWLKHARPGDQFEYHRGNLMNDRQRVVNLPNYGTAATLYNEPVHSVALEAAQASDKKIIDLVQKKLDCNGNYSYVAIRRRPRTTITRSYSND